MSLDGSRVIVMFAAANPPAPLSIECCILRINSFDSLGTGFVGLAKLRGPRGPVIKWHREASSPHQSGFSMSTVKTIGLAAVKTFGMALLGGIILVLALALGIASLPWLFPD